ncbi:MAG TPA: hypothetical protein VHD90_28125 [Phototrophicaceae bacterium]|nr:hypothetical protein [Phototrophicaceae bacterium]
MTIRFETDAPTLQAAFQDALDRLRLNVRTIAPYAAPVLIEGAEYQGAWLECAPLEGLIYAPVDAQIALNNHRIFFDHQREDGYIPCWLMPDRIGAAQIQMVVPIAASALELYQQIADRAFLEQAYTACQRWDSWLAQYRDTRATGLCEAFCEYDTGHDNSPRFAGLPHACPDKDARRCSQEGGLPYLAPDLSATVYGGRVALAQMADLLGLKDEAQAWRERAEQTRRALLAYTFDPETLCFYDLDRDNRWVRIRGDALTRVLSEHVVDQRLFEQIYARQIRNPQAFWTPYPLPSIAADDPTFVGEIPRNSWGGAAQALTALRAPRWFEYYGKGNDLDHLMRQWLKALLHAYEQGTRWRQQMNPFTGEFTVGAEGYSPAMLVMLDFTARLYGVRREGRRLIWTIQRPDGGAACQYTLDDQPGRFQLTTTEDAATLAFDGTIKLTARGDCRVITDLSGKVISVTPLSNQPIMVV